ncbi:hypothetical protein ITI46_22775 [Streptomyces oryzae]|uniref:Methyltransferase n=1 Tax=Streptomyces oryzae TaxID=1434886 RepID=A0ABS3XGE0_9ACTN|nr:hypothetical protein [Streptomyces oryzae]MBO8194463.1 hypothetical protein [Streptomyces oryzae]
MVHEYFHFPPEQVERLLEEAGVRQVAEFGLGREGLHPGPDEKRDPKRLVVARKDLGAANP